MLTQEQVTSIVRDQLALDLGCEPEVLDGPDNTVSEWRDLPGRRRYSDDRPFLEIALWKGKLAAAADPALLSWCRDYLPPRQAEWLFQPKRLRDIEAALAPHGYCVGEARHYDLPTVPSRPTLPLCPVRWYEGGELERFRGDSRWDEALAFQPHAPDLLAVAALDGTGGLLALAGASRDGARLWQIGINVLPAARGRGLGANLTALLKDELLRRDIVPFYHTEGSHLASLRVGLSAGFRPAFGYLYARRRDRTAAPV